MDEMDNLDYQIHEANNQKSFNFVMNLNEFPVWFINAKFAELSEGQ